MTSQIRAVTTVNSEGLGAAVIGTVRDQLFDRAGQAAQFMADRANLYMSQDWDLNRPYERRRWPGSPRAAGAIDWFVEQRGDDVVFGYDIADEEVTLRILGLNYGIPETFITPSGNWPLSDGIPKALSWPEGDGRRAQKYANSGGHSGSGFLERARDDAQREFISRR